MAFPIEELVTDWFKEKAKVLTPVRSDGRIVTARNIGDLIHTLSQAYKARNLTSPRLTFNGSTEHQVATIEGVLASVEVGATTCVIVVTLDRDGTMHAVSSGGKTCERIGALFRAMTAMDDAPQGDA